ncbi:MAG: LCP family protein [Candidatus Dojkabacteria bacterium]
MIYTAEVQLDKNKERFKLRKRRFFFVLLTLLLPLALGFIFANLELQTSATSTISDEPQNPSLLGQVSNLLQKAPEVIGEIWQTEFKHDNKITSALIVGIDSRNVIFNGIEFINTKPEGQAGTRNTDTILQAVYDHDTGRAFLISIPRDIGVDVSMSCLEFHGSIHWVYDKAQSAGCKGGGQRVLAKTVERITGIKIQYYGFVTLDAFKEVIDIVGEENENGEKGIWVNNPAAFYEIYPYNDHGWENVYFAQGRQFMTAERALRFVRSRQFTSDWGRARRQQIFIEAVKDRVLSAETLLNPGKILGLMGTFKDKLLFTPPSFSEVVEGIKLAQNLDQTEITNIVLSPDFGGYEVFLNKQPHDRPGGPYYMVPTSWAKCPNNVYCKVQEFIRQIMQYPSIFEEEAKIFAYAKEYGASGPNFENVNYEQIKAANLPIGVAESRYLAGAVNPKQDVMIIDYTNGKKKFTLNALEKLLGVKAVSGDAYPSVRINDEHISIVVKPT